MSWASIIDGARARRRARAALLGLVTGFGLDAASAQEAPKRVPGIERLEHIIVIYLENRSFDQLYGLFPGADGVPLTAIYRESPAVHGSHIQAALAAAPADR